MTNLEIGLRDTLERLQAKYVEVKNSKDFGLYQYGEAMRLTKSDFIESCCCAYIKEVVETQEALRLQKEKKGELYEKRLFSR